VLGASLRRSIKEKSEGGLWPPRRGRNIGVIREINSLQGPADREKIMELGVGEKEGRFGEKQNTSKKEPLSER